MSQFNVKLVSLLETYGLGVAASYSILEAVDAFKKYEKLPQATKDDLCAICSGFGVYLEFFQDGKCMVLGGISNGFYRHLLPPHKNEDKFTKFIKSQKVTRWILTPAGEFFKFEKDFSCYCVTPGFEI